MKEKKKIRLKKRSEQEIKLRRGFELPARAGNGTVSFTSRGFARQILSYGRKIGATTVYFTYVGVNGGPGPIFVNFI